MQKALRQKARTLQPIMSVGKNGLSPGLVALLDRELEQKSLVKVKFLRAFLHEHDRRDAAAELARLTHSSLVLAVGNTAVFFRAPAHSRRSSR